MISAKDLISSLPLPAIALNISGNILSANSAFASLLETETSSLEKKQITEFFSAESYDNWHLNFNPERGLLAPSPIIVKFKDKQECYSLCFEWQNGDSNNADFLIVMISDDCQTMDTLNQLEYSESQLALALESTGIGLWDHDLLTDNVLRTGQWGRMLGYSDLDISATGEAWKKLIHPDDLINVKKIALDHEKGALRLFQVEHRLKTHDGTWKWILNWGKVIKRDEFGIPIRAVGAHIDIHERKMAELALKENQTLLSKAEILANLGSFIWDIRQQRPRVSTGFKQLFQLEGAITKRIILDRVHKDDRDNLLKLIDDTRTRRDREKIHEFRIVVNNGQVRHIAGRIGIIHGEQSGNLHLIGVVQDISAIKANEHRLEELLKEKLWLFKEVHHRVKNNFQIITSLINLQIQTLVDSSESNALKVCQHRIQSMAILHHKLYRASGDSNIEMEDYLKELIVELYKALVDDASKISLDMQFGNVVLAMDDAVPLGLIVNELFTNALKYAFKDSKDGRDKIGISFSQDDEECNLIIWDNGCGISDTADTSRSLGLRLVHILAEDQLKGQCICNNDNGTRYHIIFKPGKLN
ncbi:PAS domain-containing protein [bacterium]|nr:PAS domain-containing protein [bacterium]